ncbi:MAG: hypothetical protein JW931_05225 [Methanomicrobiaceae archaeon]|nr:hypothetical protein [Methanomicrobiaceae archaeon]
MAAMNDSTRRLIMMLTIILAGTAVTFLELSPIIVIIISLVIGIVMLFGLKILSFEELKEDISSFKERLNQPISLKRTGKEKARLPKEPSKDEIKDKKREIPFAGILEKLPFKKSEKKEKEVPGEKKSFLSGLSEKINSKEKKEDKTKQIDELLDKTINEPIVSPEQPGETLEGAETGIEEDDFSDFDNLDLGLEDDESELDFEEEDESIERPEIIQDASATGKEEEIPDSAIAEILAKEGIDLDLDSDDEFPNMDTDIEGEDDQKGTDGGFGDIDELDNDISGLDLEEDELGEFDQIDLDEIEPEEDIDLEEEDEEKIEIGDDEEETLDVVMAPPDESDDLFAAPPKEWSQTKPGITESADSFGDTTSLAFGGGGDEDDLFAMLKSDTKKAVTVQEMSLVRDLKDTRIESRELVDGLETVLHQLGVKVEKIEDDEDSNPDNINEDENRG